jgi:hypothetical protein
MAPRTRKKAAAANAATPTYSLSPATLATPLFSTKASTNATPATTVAPDSDKEDHLPQPSASRSQRQTRSLARSSSAFAFKKRHANDSDALDDDESGDESDGELLLKQSLKRRKLVYVEVKTMSPTSVRGYLHRIMQRMTLTLSPQVPDD